MYPVDHGPDENTVADGSLSSGLSSSERQARPTLTVLTGLDAGMAVALEPGRYTLGRSPSATVTLDDDSVSRRHCCIDVPRLGAPSIADMGSTNGLAVNGHSIGAAELKHGDRIAIGGHTLQYVVEERERVGTHDLSGEV